MKLPKKLLPLATVCLLALTTSRCGTETGNPLKPNFPAKPPQASVKTYLIPDINFQIAYLSTWSFRKVDDHLIEVSKKDDNKFLKLTYSTMHVDMSGLPFADFVHGLTSLATNTLIPISLFDNTKGLYFAVTQPPDFLDGTIRVFIPKDNQTSDVLEIIDVTLSGGDQQDNDEAINTILNASFVGGNKIDGL